MIEAVHHVHARVHAQFQRDLDRVAAEAKAKDCEIEIPHFIAGDRQFDAIVVLRKPDDAMMAI